MRNAVIFDLDGTLIDSTGDLCAAVNAVRDRYGLTPLLEADVRPHIGGGLGSLLRCVLAEREGVVTEDDRAVFLSFYQENLLNLTRPYEALIGFLRGLEIPSALVTNKPRRFGLPILYGLDLNFRTVVFGDDGYGRKPDGEPVTTVLGRLDVAPENAIMIGDSPHDLSASEAAGVLFRAVPWSPHTQLSPHSFETVTQLRELLKVGERNERAEI